MNKQDKIKIEYISGNRAWSLCPYHDDKIRPNLSISLDKKYYGKWKCWACNRYGKLSKSKMKNLNLEEHKSYYDSTEIKCTTRFIQLTADYQKELFKFPLLEMGLCNELNINNDILYDWLVGYNGSAFTIPMYEYRNGISGIQYRYPNGQKRCMKGSQLGMFQPTGMGMCTNTLYICEGFSDAISVYNLGFEAVGRPHCHYIDETIEYLTNFDVDTIVIIPDNDKVGIKGASKLYEEVLKNITDDVHLFEFKGAKDIRQWIKKVGKLEAAYKLDRYYE